LEAAVPVQGKRARDEGSTHLACEVERLREACGVLYLLLRLHGRCLFCFALECRVVNWGMSLAPDA
jgi:hypothetical protein